MARRRAQSGGPLPLSAGPLKAALPKYMALYRRRTISGLNFPRGIKRAHDQSCSKSAGIIMNWNDLTPTRQVIFYSQMEVSSLWQKVSINGGWSRMGSPCWRAGPGMG